MLVSTCSVIILIATTLSTKPFTHGVSAWTCPPLPANRIGNVKHTWLWENIVISYRELIQSQICQLMCALTVTIYFYTLIWKSFFMGWSSVSLLFVALGFFSSAYTTVKFYYCCLLQAFYSNWFSVINLI